MNRDDDTPGSMPRAARVGWLTVIAHFMGAVLIGLSVVAMLEWIGILTVSLVEWFRFERWPSEALPLWLHIGLPTLALATWQLGRWVRKTAAV
jgi:hypothetical protein